MYGTGQNIKYIPGRYGYTVEYMRNTSVLGTSQKFFLCDLLGKAQINAGLGLTIHNVPHLSFPTLTKVWPRGLVGGMHLNGEIFLGINQFNENWERPPEAILAPEMSPVHLPQFLYRFSGKLPF